jgi:para-aminobenzoate synthetase/4-amino-4-deoxychorismate lyase
MRPEAERGVFETLKVEGGVAINLDAHLARLARSVRALYGEELPEIELPRLDGAVRITYVPGRPVAVDWRPQKPSALPIVLAPYVVPGGLGEHKWVDRRWLDARSRDGTTPLLLDADGTLLEAAWAAVLVRRDGALYTPTADGRILPSTSRPAGAVEKDLRLQPGDELLLSSSLAGVVPAVLAPGAEMAAGGEPGAGGEARGRAGAAGAGGEARGRDGEAVAGGETGAGGEARGRAALSPSPGTR